MRYEKNEDPSAIWVIIVDRLLIIGGQRVVRRKLVIDLEIVMMLRERRREKFFR